MYTPDQIKDCEILSKLIEQQTGVKREPKPKEWWYGSGELSGVKINEPCMVMTKHSPGLKTVYTANLQVGIIVLDNWLLFPLYSEGELLEMIRDVYTKNPGDGNLAMDLSIAILKEGDILTTLLELAIEVTGK